ncbi:uncharacterized protein LOC120357046 [Solenopsis invicta]|uniref:uncharacterized protein LOC120357046 n=1 Tax=Solenopsis invicta TaxID=13686 RepID=UPI00193D0CF0|nr:uncharacterized protein LOC120357046 [Solenopsis invicta]
MSLNINQYYWQHLQKRKLSAVIIIMLLECNNKKHNRRKWVHCWVAKRKEKGLHHNLFMELSLEDPNRFRRCLRMDTETFEELLERVTPLIVKKNTHLRESISAAERLSLTLRHLATGS